MKLLITALAAVSLAAVSSASWTSLGNFDGKTWYVSDSADNYLNQRASAQSNGLVIASFHNAGDETFIRTNVSMDEDLYIGFSDEVNEGTFKWDDGSAVDFTHWNPGEPNNNGDEDYTLINWGGNGEWNDINGSSVNRAIATNAPAVPEPASMCALGAGAIALLRRRRK